MGLHAPLRWQSLHVTAIAARRAVGPNSASQLAVWIATLDSSTADHPRVSPVQVRQDTDLPHHLRHLPGALMMLTVFIQSEILPVTGYQRQPAVQYACCMSQAAICALSKGRAAKGTVHWAPSNLSAVLHDLLWRLVTTAQILFTRPAPCIADVP